MNTPALGTLILLSSALLPVAQGAAWSPYCNARFAFCVQVPPGLLPQGEAPNGDGQRFRSSEGRVTLLAYGENNALDQTLRQHLAFATRGKRLTYRLERPSFYVVSGTAGQNIFYRRTVYDKGRDIFVTFEMTYPAQTRSRWDPLLARLGQSLTLKR